MAGRREVEEHRVGAIRRQYQEYGLLVAANDPDTEEDDEDQPEPRPANPWIGGRSGVY